jgi:catechol 2,3-dioxygenase-like lactoylglutathione lyase family enzyme
LAREGASHRIPFKEDILVTIASVRVLALGFVLAATGWRGGYQVSNLGSSSLSGRTSGLVNTCLITSNVRQLAEFYEPVLGLKAKWSGEEYAEFQTGVGVLAIFSFAAQEKYIPNATEPGKNRSAILEFRVTDVDQQYARLQALVKTWVKPPTTQPWGTRSVYFRDPDGNLVDFYSPAKAQ